MKHKRPLSTGFIDTAFNIAFGFIILFVLSLMLINPPKKNDDSGKITPKAEFIITLDWDDSSVDDLDLWMRDPNGKYVGFPNRESPIGFLDKDDLGWSNDTIIDPNGNKIYVKVNREVMTIRAVAPGHYILNVHMYNRINNDTFPVNTTLTVTKLNPYRVVSTIKQTFDTKGQERTMVSFDVTQHGDVINVDTDTQELFVGRKAQ